ncbi:uncharacterized protein TNCV_4753511 [Trichonephila clavipes]|nr:uncharacterized protein TNCV_4753511 [Trichonephila clavipes]
MIGIVFKASADIGEKFAKLCNPADCHPPVSFPSPLLEKCSLFNDFQDIVFDAETITVVAVNEKVPESHDVNIKPDGHGYELVSSVRALVPQKFSVEEELMHVKHVEVKSPHVGVMWKCSRCRGKKLFKTDKEAVEYLFSEELESKMIALPPEIDELTDEEGFDDTETLDPSVRDVAGSIEISVPYENHDDHREADLSNKSKK